MDEVTQVLFGMNGFVVLGAAASAARGRAQHSLPIAK